MRLYALWDRSRTSSQFRSFGLSHLWCCGVADRSPRAAERHSARSEMARSQIDPRIGRGKAGHGRAVQAFALVESGVVDRATANSLPRTAAGHKQDDQAAETKPRSGSCSRILDQSLEPARVRSSRNRPLERASAIARFAQGWAGRSPPLTPKPLASHRTPDPDVDALRSGHSPVESGSLSFMR